MYPEIQIISVDSYHLSAFPLGANNSYRNPQKKSFFRYPELFRSLFHGIPGFSKGHDPYSFFVKVCRE